MKQNLPLSNVWLTGQMDTWWTLRIGPMIKSGRVVGSLRFKSSCKEAKMDIELR